MALNPYRQLSTSPLRRLLSIRRYFPIPICVGSNGFVEKAIRSSLYLSSDIGMQLKTILLYMCSAILTAFSIESNSLQQEDSAALLFVISQSQSLAKRGNVLRSSPRAEAPPFPGSKDSCTLAQCFGSVALRCVGSEKQLTVFTLAWPRTAYIYSAPCQSRLKGVICILSFCFKQGTSQAIL